MIIMEPRTITLLAFVGLMLAAKIRMAHLL
jgi:hypothetical protein